MSTQFPTNYRIPAGIVITPRPLQSIGGSSTRGVFKPLGIRGVGCGTTDTYAGGAGAIASPAKNTMYASDPQGIKFLGPSIKNYIPTTVVGSISDNNNPSKTYPVICDGMFPDTIVSYLNTKLLSNAAYDLVLIGGTIYAHNVN